MLKFLNWREAATQEIAWPDIYFTPSYGHVVEASDNAQWELALWSNGPILYPYLKRPIPDSSDYFDIVSPYGYAGIWAPEQTSIAEYGAFRQNFREEMVSRGCVAEFLRQGTLVGNQPILARADPSVEWEERNRTVAINLSQGFDSYWIGAEHRSRKAVRKARRLGYETAIRKICSDELKANAPFIELYHQSMERLGASAYYFFNECYFSRLAENLKDQCYLASVSDVDGHIVVSGLCLVWPPYLHFHLIGFAASAMNDGVGNLFYNDVISWGCARSDIQVAHLGGGRQIDDSLFKFKIGFGGAAISFFIGKSIFLADVYDELIDASAAHLGISKAELRGSNHFPAYRGFSA